MRITDPNMSIVDNTLKSLLLRLLCFRDFSKFFFQETAHFKFNTSFRRYLNAFKCFGVLSNPCCTGTRLKNTEIAKLQTIVGGELIDNLIKELLDDTLNDHPLCLGGIRNS